MAVVIQNGMQVGPNRSTDLIVGNSFSKTYKIPVKTGYIVAMAVTAAREVGGNAMRVINLLITLWNDESTPAVAVMNDALSTAAGNNITMAFASDPNDRQNFIITVGNADTGTLIVSCEPIASIMQ